MSCASGWAWTPARRWPSWPPRARLIEGAFRPGGSGREWIEPEVLRRVRRRTLAHLRRAVEPVEPEALARFLPGWQGIGRDMGRGEPRLREVISQLGGVALPVAAWEQDVLPLRVPGYQPALLDALCAAGEAVWIGAGEGRVALYLRDDAAAAGRRRAARGWNGGAGHRRYTRCGFVAGSWRVVLPRAGRARRASRSGPCWPRCGSWSGPAPSPTTPGIRCARAGASRFARCRRRCSAAAPGPTAALPAALGRWSLVSRLLEPEPAPRDRVRALSEALLDRHGVVTRAAVLAEGLPGGYSSVYGELRLMEEGGLCQRGYFVEGLGGAQFALPAAVERLRDVRDPAQAGGATAVLAAVDPANPYGATIPWPAAGRKLARAAGAWVVLVSGRLALYVERGGRGLVVVDPELLEPAIEALASLVREGRVKRLAIERIDGEPVAGTEAERLLVAHGFLQAPRRVVLRA